MESNKTLEQLKYEADAALAADAVNSTLAARGDAGAAWTVYADARDAAEAAWAVYHKARDAAYDSAATDAYIAAADAALEAYDNAKTMYDVALKAQEDSDD